MEVKGAKAHKGYIFLYEMLGTAVLMTGINASSAIGGLKPIGIALTLFAAIVVFGHPGGAHFNPAVTIGVFVREFKLANLPIALMMIVAQITGAFLAELLVYTRLPDSLTSATVASYGMNVLCPPTGTNAKNLATCTPTAPGQMLIAETWGTFILVATVLTAKFNMKDTMNPGLMPPLVVGISLLVGISWSAGISGACLNPAVGIANSFFQFAIRN